MKRLSILLFIAILTFIAVLYVKRPDLLTHVWLWVIGLAAPIIGLFKRVAEYLKTWFHEKIQKKTNKPVSTPPLQSKTE